MKTTTTIAVMAAALIGLAGCAMQEKKNCCKQAKITKAQAEKIALAKVHGGKVKESELEKEHGKCIWSVDIAKHGTKNTTEVAVDAMTGKVLSVEIETPAQEAKEKAEEAKKKH